MPEAAEDRVSYGGDLETYENSRLEDRPILPDSDTPEVAEKHQPFTASRDRHIAILDVPSPQRGGMDGETSDRVIRLPATIVSWPLDPDQLQQRGANAGAESDGQWKTAHGSLLASVRLDLQNYVDLRLATLRNKLSHPLGPARSSQSQGPRELVRRAEEELKQLALCRKWGWSPDRLPLLGAGNGAPDRASGPHHHRQILETTTSTNLFMDWFLLIAIGLVCVTVEAAANISLLMKALEGAALEAFLLAVLVSVINVGGFGITAGCLLFTLSRQISSTKPWVYRAAWAIWILSALGFNLVAGRHREAYGQVTQSMEKDLTAAIPTAGEQLSEVSFVPLSWEFEALLFSLLGIFLCVLGFVKGFTFMRRTAEKSGASGQRQRRDNTVDCEQDESAQTGGADEVMTPYNRQLFDTFNSLPRRYQRGLTELRREVASWYRSLDWERRSVATLVERLKVKENRQASVDILEHAFIVAHNASYPRKIDPQSVEAHRIEQYAEPFAVTASDSEVLSEAGALVSEWRESGHTGFDERIAAAYQEIIAIWDNYTPLVLDNTERMVANGTAPQS